MEKRDKRMFLLIFAVLVAYGILMTIMFIRGNRARNEAVETNESYIVLENEVKSLRKTLASIETRKESDSAIEKTIRGFTEAWFNDAWYTNKREKDCREYLTNEDVLAPWLPYISGDPAVADNPIITLSDFNFTYRQNEETIEAVATIGYDVVVKSDDYEKFRTGYVAVLLEQQSDGNYLICEVKKISDLLQ